MSRRLIGPRDLPEGHQGQQFLLGRTPLLASQFDQRFSYCLYVPSKGPRSGVDWPVVVAIHGTGRDVHDLREGLVALADNRQCVVVVPLFPGGIDHPNDLDNYKFIDFEEIRFDLVLISMLDEVAERFGAAVGKVFLHGFSGGAQFVHRFAYLHPERLAALSIGAPGRTTLLDQAALWPDGTADTVERFGIEVDLSALKEVPAQIVVGSADIDPGDLAPGSTGGATRVERAERLAANWRANGISVQFDVVAGAGHDREANLPLALKFLEARLSENGS